MLLLSAAETAHADIREETVIATNGSKISAITVTTNITEADIYLDGEYMGQSPLSLGDVKPGRRSLVIKKDKYYTMEYVVDIRAGETKELYVELVAATGTLVIENVPDNAIVAVDRIVRDSRDIELAEGGHIVVIKAFGFIDKQTEVRIVRHEKFVLDAQLKKADFTASDLRPIKKTFNPENPEKLGISGVTFSVTAPGTGRLAISDESGKEVRSFALEPFTSWQQTVFWDGKDSAGTILPDGTYTVTLTASSGDETKSSDAAAPGNVESKKTLTTTIKIDRSIRYPLTVPWIGVGASGPVVSGSLMPRGSAMLCTDARFVADGFSPALSVSAGITEHLEAALRAGALVGDGKGNGLSVSGGLKAGLSGLRINSALALHYTGDDGISFGPAVEYRLRRFAAGVNAELTYGDRNGYLIDPFYSASAGLALRYVGDALSGAIWSTARTARTGTSFAMPGIIGAGVSVLWIIPSTDFVLSAETGYYHNPHDDDTVYGRVAFGLLF